MAPLIEGPWGPNCALGEGPRWDQARQRLLWVDIETGRLLEAPLEGTAVGLVRTRSIAPTLGAVTPTSDGGVLAAGHDRLVLLAADGTRHESRRLVPDGHRFNDGAADPAGRYLVGTLSLGATSWDEQLLRLEHDGSVTVLDDDLGLSNGLAWSTDGARLFSVDTERQVVFVRDYDVVTGDTSSRTTWVEIPDGLPDGVWMDEEDHLWVAIWGGGVVHRFSPAGARVCTVQVPAPHTTAVAFAGDAHDVLVVTTASTGLDATRREGFPASGRMFTARVPVPGLPCTPWSVGPLPL